MCRRWEGITGGNVDLVMVGVGMLIYIEVEVDWEAYHGNDS